VCFATGCLVINVERKSDSDSSKSTPKAKQVDVSSDGEISER